ncbi:uncharacterized protein LOC129585137 isoform X2 [Paramacrobiotus metropolitanus]|uniref:uncharacterized protein LOC129585137 isoform X2 n=1 Tax=Paramacrobiotus metropolitanus TaxID=2943436 RepID=UPI0024459373|nr:uncharacterized protein LOC129585137 isoform X2 [Paramacrobiotus metropolitanus]
MSHLLVVAAVAVCLASFIPNSLACVWTPKRAQKQKEPVDTMDEILNEAKKRNSNGTMHLRRFGRGPSVAGYPNTEWPPQTELIQAPEGGTLFLPCNNTNRLVPHTNIPPACTRNGLLLTLNNAPVFRHELNQRHSYCNCTNRTGTRQGLGWHSVSAGNYDRDSGAFTIALDNFTYAHSGLYECLHSNGSQLVVTKRYYVSATLFRPNVFQPPMQNVTVRHGDPAAMVCAVRFNFLPGKLATRFLWRSERHCMIAESIAEVAKKAKLYWGFYGGFDFNENDDGGCSSTMTIQSVTWQDAGRYECWLRINDRLDEWIMQEAYLHVV